VSAPSPEMMDAMVKQIAWELLEAWRDRFMPAEGGQQMKGVMDKFLKAARERVAVEWRAFKEAG
jgi:hypothetical protein